MVADKGVIPKQIGFNVRLALSSSAAWLSAPGFLDMMNAARPLSVQVDVPALPPGAHFARYGPAPRPRPCRPPPPASPLTAACPQPQRLRRGLPGEGPGVPHPRDGAAARAAAAVGARLPAAGRAGRAVRARRHPAALRGRSVRPSCPALGARRPF